MIYDITKWNPSSPSDPRLDAAVCDGFAVAITTISNMEQLLQYRSQCNTGRFCGRVISIIEGELMLRATNSNNRESLRLAMDLMHVRRDPNLIALIQNMHYIMASRPEKVWREFTKNVPMDKMTTGTACVLTGTGLVMMGWQNLAVGTQTKDASQAADGRFQIFFGVFMIAVPVVNAMYYALRTSGRQ